MRKKVYDERGLPVHQAQPASSQLACRLDEEWIEALQEVRERLLKREKRGFTNTDVTRAATIFFRDALRAEDGKEAKRKPRVKRTKGGESEEGQGSEADGVNP